MNIKKEVSAELQELKIKGLKMAVGDFNRWEKAARIYFDRSDMSVVTVIYQDLNSWTEFKFGDIVEVFNKNDLDYEKK